MGVADLSKLMRLEWKKLNTTMVVSELIIYLIILLFLPTFFLLKVLPVFGASYEAAIELGGFIQMGYVLFGGSLINHLFIEEYKSKTMSLSYSYPFSRQKLYTAKVLFIAIFVFMVTLISFLLSGLTTYLLDGVYQTINGQPTATDLVIFVKTMLTRSIMVTFISFIPLFLFGVWKRAVVPAIMCSLISMQLPNFSSFINVDPDVVVMVLSVLGAISVFVSIKTANSVGEV
jgi:ABC-type transport system involved in multi-copper enzyme maturation permease subunit